MNEVLRAANLGFAYPNTKPVLEDWTADFYPGEIVAITGPSGRGKSTLMYLLGLMLKPSSGRVMVNGVEASTLSDARRAHLRAHDFGFVFQDAALDSTRSVLDNVLESTLYRGEKRNPAKHRALSLLDSLGVSLRADARPGEVSGGQAQRIAIARAMLARPKIILADEPTGNLDPVTTAVVVNVLREQAAEGASVILVTHDPELVPQCDRELPL